MKEIHRKTNLLLGEVGLSTDILDEKYKGRSASVLSVDREYLWFSAEIKKITHRDELDYLNPKTLEEFYDKNPQNPEYCNVLRSVFKDKPKNITFASHIKLVHANETFLKTVIVLAHLLMTGKI